MNELMQTTANRPLVTIGLMTYNYPGWGERDHFLKALDSLVLQDYENKEILIIDDCSHDSIYEDCLTYSKRYSNVRVFRNERNIGAIENFKKLIGKIEGQLFLWACPDDIYDKSFVSTCVKQFMKNATLAIAATAIKAFHENGEIHIYRYQDFLSKLPLRKIARNVFRSRDSRGEYVRYSPVIHSSIVRTDCISKMFHENLMFFAEELWFLNALVYGNIGYTDELLYFRYCSNASHHEKNPELSAKLSFRLSTNIQYLWGYLNYFWLKKDIPLSKKLKLMVPFIQAVRYRFFIKMWNASKCTLLKFIRKFGLMNYELE